MEVANTPLEATMPLHRRRILTEPHILPGQANPAAELPTRRPFFWDSRHQAALSPKPFKTGTYSVTIQGSSDKIDNLHDPRNPEERINGANAPSILLL